MTQQQEYQQGKRQRRPSIVHKDDADSINTHGVPSNRTSWHDSIDISLSSRPDEEEGVYDDVNPRRTTVIVPLDEEVDDEYSLSETLCKIHSKRYSTMESMDALDTIHHLAASAAASSSSSEEEKENGSSTFIQEFYELGGMIHIINFFNLHQHVLTDDTTDNSNSSSSNVQIEKVIAVIVWCTYSGTHQHNRAIASSMAQQLIQKGGIPLLLKISEDCTSILSLDFSDDSTVVQAQLCSLKLIWQALGNILSKLKARALVDRDMSHAVVNSALDCLDKVATISTSATTSTSTTTSSSLPSSLSMIVNYVIYKAIHCIELIYFPKKQHQRQQQQQQQHPSSLPVTSTSCEMSVTDDAKRIVSTILYAMKLPNGGGSNNTTTTITTTTRWRFDSEKAPRASMRIFMECCCKHRTKNVPSSSRTTLTSALSPTMIKNLIPFCVACIKAFPYHTKICHRGLAVLQQACTDPNDMVQITLNHERARIHQAVGAILRLSDETNCDHDGPSSSSSLDNGVSYVPTKRRARLLMKALYMKG